MRARLSTAKKISNRGSGEGRSFIEQHVYHFEIEFQPSGIEVERDLVCFLINCILFVVPVVF